MLPFNSRPVVGLLGTLVFGLPASSTLAAGHAWLDPAVRHTNGMRIASSEPHRSSSVNWTCNPDQPGYCGGRYYWPCLDSIRRENIARDRHGCYAPPGSHYRSHACGSDDIGGWESAATEPIGMAILGEIPNELLDFGVRPAAPPGGG